MRRRLLYQIRNHNQENGHQKWICSVTSFIGHFSCRFVHYRQQFPFFYSTHSNKIWNERRLVERQVTWPCSSTKVPPVGLTVVCRTAATFTVWKKSKQLTSLSDRFTTSCGSWRPVSRTWWRWPIRDKVTKVGTCWCSRYPAEEQPRMPSSSTVVRSYVYFPDQFPNKLVRPPGSPHHLHIEQRESRGLQGKTLITPAVLRIFQRNLLRLIVGGKVYEFVFEVPAIGRSRGTLCSLKLPVSVHLVETLWC